MSVALQGDKGTKRFASNIQRSGLIGFLMGCADLSSKQEATRTRIRQASDWYPSRNPWELLNLDPNGLNILDSLDLPDDDFCRDLCKDLPDGATAKEWWDTIQLCLGRIGGLDWDGTLRMREIIWCFASTLKALTNRI
jgi:hypothetical protein